MKRSMAPLATIQRPNAPSAAHSRTPSRAKVKTSSFTATGSLYDVAYATSPLRGPGGAVGAIVEARDITIEKSVEAERLLLLDREQRARSEAEAANRAKDEFLAMLGHELRNPLAAISNASHLLDHPASEHAAPARAVIKRQSSHLTRLVDDLLDAGRVASGKIVLAQGPVELASVIRRTFTTLKASGRTARHQVTVDLEPAWVLGDETRLEQIVTNLLTNALRYTPAGGHIAITLKATTARRCFRFPIAASVFRATCCSVYSICSCRAIAGLSARMAVSVSA